MSLKNIRSDLIDIFDVTPEWSKHLKYNPISDIIKNGKPYHLITLMKDVFGAKNNNPIMGNIRYHYYKESQVESIFDNIKDKINKISAIKEDQMDDFLDIIALLGKIDYFQIYTKQYMDLLIKEIIRNDLFLKTSNIKYRASLIFLINKLGYNNIFLERALKGIEKYQNSDGGWPLDIKSSDKKTDIFSTLIVYRTFTNNSLWLKQDFLIEVESYLLQNHLASMQTHEELDKWNRLYTGYKKNNLFEGGSVILLECLLLFRKNKNIDKIKSIINWLKAIQLKTGYFPYHANLKGQENISCTIKILSLFKKYYII